jgi:hypothetical protein
MQLVDPSGQEIFAHCRYTAADLHVAAGGGRHGPLQRDIDTFGYEDKGGVTFHLYRIATMVCQHKGRRVIGRIASPPAFPVLVQPGAADRTKHVAAEDESAEPIHRTVGIGLIDPVGTAVLTNHGPEHARAEHPFVPLSPARAERIFMALLRAAPEPVARDGKTCYAHFCH